MADSPIRISFIGAGTNTRERHIPELQAIEGVELVGVVNRTRSSSEQVAQEFGLERVYGEWTEAVADEEIDALVIGTWPYLHAPATIAALEAGKHVLCEARMAMNAQEAREMYQAAHARPELVSQIVPSPLTLEVDPTIQRLLAEGYVGEVLAVEVRACQGFVDYDAALHWRHSRDLSGMNTMSLGIWYEALMRWVGEATRVAASGETFVKTRVGNSGKLSAIGIPDHLHVIGEMACGARLHMTISQVCGLAGPAEARLFGSAGTIRWSEGRLWGGRRGEEKLAPLEIRPQEEGHWQVEKEFVGAIRGERKIELTTFRDGVKYMEFTEAVFRSMANNCFVALPLE